MQQYSPNNKDFRIFLKNKIIILIRLSNCLLPSKINSWSNKIKVLLLMTSTFYSKDFF